MTTKWANALLQDGGSDLLRTRAATVNRLMMHLIKAYTANDSYATVLGNSLGSVATVAADYVQSGAAGAARVTTIAAKTIASLTASSTQHDNGTATSGAATSLTDTGKAFTVNAHAGRALVLLTGTGAGQSRRILSNTATALTVEFAWGTNPAAGTTYAIRDDLGVAILDSVSSDVMLVNDETSDQQVNSGGSFAIPSFTYTVNQPTNP